MKKSKETLPLFGIGPIYVVLCFGLTALGLYLNKKGVLNIGQVPSIKPIMIGIGIVLILIGLAIYIYAVFIQKILKEVKAGHLLTTGVYAIVRNPVYSAFLLVFSGILFLTGNLILLVFPFLYWLFLTILLKNTEEKWLVKEFGNEYREYCKRVNRAIPWFKQNKEEHT